MNNKEYEKEILEAAEEGKISCKAVMKLAARLGVPKGKMAELLDQYQVKIKECQLGCFK